MDPLPPGEASIRFWDYTRFLDIPAGDWFAL